MRARYLSVILAVLLALSLSLKPVQSAIFGTVRLMFGTQIVDSTHGLPVSSVAGTATIGGTTDAGPAWTVAQGIAGVAFTSADQSAAAAAVTSAPTTGKHLVITDLVISTDTALSLSFTEETSGTLVWKTFLGANSTTQITPRSFLQLPTINKRLMVQASVAGNLGITASYFSQ